MAAVAPVRGVQDGPLGAFIRNYIERVVNRRDLTAVDDFVSTDYVGRGPGWAANIEELRRFYVEQIRNRPDWHIDVQETVELGDSVVILALAGGAVASDGKSRHNSLEWLAHYRVADRRITEIHILAVAQLGSTDGTSDGEASWASG